MFTSLLPGIRDLRAPLAAGYVWLLFGWLVFEPRYGMPTTGSPLYLDTLALIQKISPVALAVAVSFAAYLVGSLSLALMEFGQRLTAANGYMYLWVADDYDGRFGKILKRLKRLGRVIRIKFSRYDVLTLEN